MGWNHPEIGLEEMVKLVKGFFDILILSSGYQSSGLVAQWDAHNVKRAFSWALFFERVLSELKSSDYYVESVDELDAALSELKSQASFPQGLANISSDTLLRARSLIVEHMIHTLPLRDAHVKAVLTAVVEMDLDALPETAQDGLGRYLNKLSLQNNSDDSFQDCAYSEKNSDMGIGNLNSYDWTSTSIQELSRRQSAVLSISSLQKSLSVFSSTIGNGGSFQVSSSMLREQPKHKKFSVSEDEMAEFITFNRWKSKNLLYFLDKRTIRLVSGVSMMFSSPKNQWLRVFECLAKLENLHERVELLILGCVVDRWTNIIKHFQSVSFDCLTTLDRFSEVHNLLLGRPQRPLMREESVNLKERGVLDHLTELLGCQSHVLWKLSPALLAAAIPSWSTIFRIYLNQIGIHLKGESATLRYCGCNEERKEHRDCELAERIWCLYAFHFSSSLVNGE
ncbi:uncharacterized protein LOC116212302 isoform X1 [Punica granatum]|uniref:Uncharacterized protein LOC116212302 isoform X1 n=2 Tax=Punica granatum TaxID=22663 RepID=A0A6P8EBS6_PUNGR|nr:uncharacterized protein LOC116212302 isoform X1 [Punica granatum]XP_031402725.1 uncharacterized protein LOC116212302 isoform X1 [Punica granatum]XP_031402728.1 uncharacterized protein LOC116212302 isoform X1 [Punica granatum]